MIQGQTLPQALATEASREIPQSAFSIIIIILIVIMQQFNNHNQFSRCQQKLVIKMSLKDFTILQELGSGSYATVFKVCRKTDNKIYALKQIRLNSLDDKSKNNALNQVRFLASFDSASIISYHEAFIEEGEGLLCIVMEFAQDGDLTSLIEEKRKRDEMFSETQIWRALVSLLKGVEYLHKRSILHRDIKPANIFISKGEFKLGDLNVSKLKKDNRKLTQTGTPYYASPEVWNNRPYDEKTDIWSIGCSVYEMATLKPPFQSTKMDKLFHEVTKSKHKPISQCFSKELSNLIDACLSKDPKKRPSIDELMRNWTLKMYSNLEQSDRQQSNNKQQTNLLKTINFPKNMVEMKDIELPKSNYQGPLKHPQRQNASQVQQPTFRQTGKQSFHNQGSFTHAEPSSKQPDSPVLNLHSHNKLINNLHKIKSELRFKDTGDQAQRTQARPKRRSSPRTELSCQKLKTECVKDWMGRKMKAFDEFGEKQNGCGMLDGRIPKVLKKRVLVEELARNQQKALKNLVGKSKSISPGLITPKDILNDRFQRVVREASR